VTPDSRVVTRVDLAREVRQFAVLRREPLLGSLQFAQEAAERKPTTHQLGVKWWGHARLPERGRKSRREGAWRLTERWQSGRIYQLSIRFLHRSRRDRAAQV